MSWKLQAVTGEFSGQEIDVVSDMLVGRHQDADLLLQAAEISRKHAILLYRDNQLWVQDLNSSNGTFVNDIRVEQEAQLNDGDILQFADLKFSVLAHVDDVIVVEQDQVEAIEPIQPIQQEEPQTLKTNAEVLHDKGMPSLEERASETVISREGMPESVAIPKPAPIPKDIDPAPPVDTFADPTTVIKNEPIKESEQKMEQSKNASIGLMTIIVVIVLAIIAWIVFR